jgi:flagellar protein FliS
VTVTSRGIDAYRRTEAQSASPLQLVVMLYDGALRFLNDARAAQISGDARKRAHAIRRVTAIVAECHSTLDLERGGALAAELDGLYSYMSARLLDITVKRDHTAIDEVYKLMSILRDAWGQVAQAGSPVPAVAPAAAARARDLALRP